MRGLARLRAIGRIAWIVAIPGATSIRAQNLVYVEEAKLVDDGNGAAGGIAASYIVRWDGSSWSALGTGTNNGVSALAAFDDGNGPALYAGGYFSIAGGVSTSRIAKWDGASWSALDGQMGGPGVFHYQLWYRNTPASFCDPVAAFNVSSGLSIAWP